MITVIPAPPEIKKHICKYCKTSLSRSTHLRRHMLTCKDRPKDSEEIKTIQHLTSKILILTDYLHESNQRNRQLINESNQKYKELIHSFTEKLEEYNSFNNSLKVKIQSHINDVNAILEQYDLISEHEN